MELPSPCSSAAGMGGRALGITGCRWHESHSHPRALELTVGCASTRVYKLLHGGAAGAAPPRLNVLVAATRHRDCVARLLPPAQLLGLGVKIGPVAVSRGCGRRGAALLRQPAKREGLGCGPGARRGPTYRAEGSGRSYVRQGHAQQQGAQVQSTGGGWREAAVGGEPGQPRRPERTDGLVDTGGRHPRHPAAAGGLCSGRQGFPNSKGGSGTVVRLLIRQN